MAESFAQDGHGFPYTGITFALGVIINTLTVQSGMLASGYSDQACMARLMGKESLAISNETGAADCCHIWSL